MLDKVATNPNQVRKNPSPNRDTLRQKFVSFLVEPSASVPPADHRNVRLSAWLTLLMAAASWPVVPFFPNNRNILMGAIFFTIAYILCRTRYFRFGIYIVIAGFGIVPLLHASGLPSGSADQMRIVATLMWLVPLMLIASSVLPLRPNIIIVGVFVLAIFLMPFYGTHLSFAQTGLGLMFIGLTGGLVLIFLNHRDLLERDRQAELRMANDALRASEAILEQRVNERTRDLQIATDISLQITTQLDSSQLLADIVERTAQAFGLYHVSLFLYDQDEALLKLKQGVGSAGDRMVAMGKHFKLTDKGLVPGAAQTQHTALSNDVARDPDYTHSPLLPDTRSELAIPMIYRGTLIGVLDIQSEQLNRFRDDDVRIMRTLADQIAVAVRNSQLFEETSAAKQEAEKANTVKSMFLSSMSHELRTPLNAIINFSKFLKKGIPGPINEEQGQLIGGIADSGQHLLNLINDVLDMSKIESGSLSLYVESGIDLRQIIETALQYTRPIVADKPVEMQEDIPDHLPTLTGDRKRLLQIFLNVLSNACKFTEEGSVKISVHENKDQLLVSVKDTGPGIAPEDTKDVFTAFKQTESGLRQGGNGTGLGMPICQKLVEAHEGRIWFESQVGAGTTFYVELPLQTQLKAEMRKQSA